MSDVATATAALGGAGSNPEPIKSKKSALTASFELDLSSLE